MDLTTITVTQFKTRFYRDFNFMTAEDGAIPLIPDQDFVQDRDIDNAFQDAQQLLNQGLFGDNTEITLAYLYLTAHCLCLNINNANAGLGATAGMPVNSRSVGSVSESYTIPPMFVDQAIYAPYIGTAYGLKYLTMAMPGLTGNMVGVYGGTQP